MEEILQKCLKADNEAIQQGTQDLKEALKKPEAVAALCNVVVSAPDEQVRQYAAVVLQKRLSKYKQWSKLSENDRSLIKQGILQAVLNEPHKPVKKSIAHFIGVIMKHETNGKGWPELQQVLFELRMGNDMARKELGLYLLSVLVDMSPKLLLPQADQLCQHVSTILKTAGDEHLTSPIVYFAIDILKSLSNGDENVQAVVNTTYEVLPIIVRVIYALARLDEAQAVKTIQLLDDLSDNVPTAFDTHLKLVVEMCVSLGKEASIDDNVRMRALAFLGLLVTKKKKALIHHDLIKPILDALFVIMSTPPKDPEDVDEDDDDDDPATTANQTLDSMALHLPPGKVVTPMLKHIEMGIQSSDPYTKKAACLAVAVMAEGCAEHIRTRHLKQFVQFVLSGIVDPHPAVRNAALFALGQFSEHLQPDISQYADEVMPVLFNYLEHLCQTLGQQGDAQAKLPPHVTRMFYALEMFCENLNERLKPYLPLIVERLLLIFDSPNPVTVRELAISAFNSAASAAKEDVAPYVPRVLESLHVFLTKEQSDEFLTLQIHSIDSLAVLARCLGKENFRPLAKESLQLGLTLIEKIDDPDLRKTTYGLLGALSTILETEMQTVLEHVVNIMLGTLKSEEGNKVLDLADADASNLSIYDDLSDENDEEDIGDESDRSDDDDIEVHIEDAFTEEKEAACAALGEIAGNTGPAFLPYYEMCFEQLVKMVNHPGGSVRCAALDALAEMCAAISTAAPDKDEDQQKVLAFIVPKCAEVIQTDYDRDAVAAALDALDILLVKIKGGVLKRDGHLEAIVNSLTLVLSNKTQCQEEDEDLAADEDGEAEQDELLFEYAGNVLPSLGKALPPERFAEIFKGMLPLLLSKVKEHSSTAQKSFVVGTLAETMEPLSVYSGAFVDQLLPLFSEMAVSEEDEVRNNAMFALGTLVFYAKEAVYPHYPAILRLLSDAVSKETVPNNLDNICGAIARMILTNASLIPIESVVPVLIQHLPLREDFEENLSVFRCLNLLYELQHPVLKDLIPAILKIAITVIYKKDHTKQETLDNVVNLLGCIKRDFPDVFLQATSELTPEHLQVLQERLA